MSPTSQVIGRLQVYRDESLATLAGIESLVIKAKATVTSDELEVALQEVRRLKAMTQNL